jgi:hypothetical protein
LVKRSSIPVTINQHEPLARVSLRHSPTYIISERSLNLKEVLHQHCPLLITAILFVRVRIHVSEQVADPFGRYSGRILFHGDDASLLGEYAQALQELLDACWRSKGLEKVAVSLQAATLALRDGVCDPANAHNFLSGNIREDVDFELVGEGEECTFLQGLW